MSPNDDIDLKKELASPPLARHGFSNGLRKRIEQEINLDKGMRKRDRTRAYTRMGFRWFGAVGSLCAVMLLLFVASQSGWMERRPEPLLIGSPRTAATAAEDMPEETFKLHSTVMIGLRTDLPSGESTYRTLLIAPDGEHLNKVSEGSGILVPYGRDFWKIDTVENQAGSSGVSVLSQQLVAHKAEQPLAEALKNKEAAFPSGDQEKLLFVGNRYVSMMEQHADQAGSADHASKQDSYHFWVKELPQMTADARVASVLNKAAVDRYNAVRSEAQMKARGQMPQEAASGITNNKPAGAEQEAAGPSAALPPTATSMEPSIKANDHVSLQTIFGTVTDEAADIGRDGDQWAIVRTQGQWVPKIAAGPNVHNDTASAGADSALSDAVLQDFPFPLPETVKSYDQLCCSWNEIELIHPGAKDAFSSPALDIVAIVTSTEVTFYKYTDHIVDKPLLSFKLQPNESIIMTQWAIDNYVEKWKDKVSKLLNP